MLGLMASTTAVIHHARLHMRPPQNWLLGKFEMGIDPYWWKLAMPRQAILSLFWWLIDSNLLEGMPLAGFSTWSSPVHRCLPDGWGTHCGSVCINGQWSPVESRLRINVLELEAIRYALASVSDIVHAAAFHRQHGSQILYQQTRGNELLQIVQGNSAFMGWGIQNKVELIATHIAGQDNSTAN